MLQFISYSLTCKVYELLNDLSSYCKWYILENNMSNIRKVSAFETEHITFEIWFMFHLMMCLLSTLDAVTLIQHSRRQKENDIP